VVRTKRDGERPSSAQVCSKTSAYRSTSWRTGTPRCEAVSTIFSPCWSTPETLQVTSPRAACQRTSVSTTTVV